MRIIDNFLPSAYQDKIEDVMLGAGFPWYLNAYTALPTDIALDTTTDSYQFTHKFYEDGRPYSDHYTLISLIMYHLMLTENIDTTELFRVKANLNTPIKNYPKENHYIAHTDCFNVPPYITAIYYVNNSDGDTKFFDDFGNITNSIAPKKGRLVYFNGNIQHAGAPPQSYTTRCIINFNFLAKETK